MISAKEAKSISDAAPSEHLDNIDKKIRESAGKGMYGCDYVMYSDSTIVDSVKASLETVGFNVESGSEIGIDGRFRYRLCIKWDEPAESSRNDHSPESTEPNPEPEPTHPGDSWLLPVKIGKQVWSGKNLSFDDWGEGIYHNEYNGETYYTWDAAGRVAGKIPGWHLPTREEWQELVEYCGGDEKAGNALKASTGWNGEANGSDELGFSAVPGGNWNYSFRYVSLRAYFWTATEYGCNGAYGRYFASCSTVYEYCNTRCRAFSLRLVKDSAE